MEFMIPESETMSIYFRGFFVAQKKQHFNQSEESWEKMDASAYWAGKKASFLAIAISYGYYMEIAELTACPPVQTAGVPGSSRSPTA